MSRQYGRCSCVIYNTDDILILAPVAVVSYYWIQIYEDFSAGSVDVKQFMFLSLYCSHMLHNFTKGQMNKLGITHNNATNSLFNFHVRCSASEMFTNCNINYIADTRRTSCSSYCFPCVGVRQIQWSLRSTATFVICFHRSLLLAFSLHFYSSSAFLRSLFTQSSHLSCGLHRFLEPSCFFVSALFGSLSSFIRTMCPAHFIRLLTCIIYNSFIKRLKC